MHGDDSVHRSGGWHRSAEPRHDRDPGGGQKRRGSSFVHGLVYDACSFFQALLILLHSSILRLRGLMTAAVLQIVGLAITVVAGLILSIEIVGGRNVLAWATDLQGIAFGIRKPKVHHHTTTGRIGIVITFMALGVTLYLLTELGLWFHANVSANKHVNAGVNYIVGIALLMAILYGTLGVLTGLIRLLAYAVSLAVERRAGVVGIVLLVFGTVLQILGTVIGNLSPAAIPPT